MPIVEYRSDLPVPPPVRFTIPSSNGATTPFQVVNVGYPDMSYNAMPHLDHHVFIEGFITFIDAETSKMYAASFEASTVHNSSHIDPLVNDISGSVVFSAAGPSYGSNLIEIVPGVDNQVDGVIEITKIRSMYV